MIQLTDKDRAAFRKALVSKGIRTRGMTDEQLQQEFDAIAQPATIADTIATLDDTLAALEEITPTKETETKQETKQEAKPMPAAPSHTDQTKADELARVLRDLVGKQDQPLDEGRVIDLIKQHGNQPTTINVKVNDVKKDTAQQIDGAHPILPTVLNWIATNTHVYLTGGAGSGKTTIAEQTAKALNRDFYHNGALLVKFELIGFIDANGKYHTTSFREAYEKGGVYLFDEIDGSNDQAVLAMNQALANGEYAFPDQIVKKHPNFVAIAAANTVGTGATMQYVGRNPLDGASLDRFVQVQVDYDLAIETQMAQRDYAAHGGTNQKVPELWVGLVRAVRNQALESRWPHLITPRASMFGARGLAAGIAPLDVINQTITKHFSDDQKAKVKQIVDIAAKSITNQLAEQ